MGEIFVDSLGTILSALGNSFRLSGHPVRTLEVWIPLFCSTQQEKHHANGRQYRGQRKRKNPDQDAGSVKSSFTKCLLASAAVVFQQTQLNCQQSCFAFPKVSQQMLSSGKQKQSKQSQTEPSTVEAPTQLFLFRTRHVLEPGRSCSFSLSAHPVQGVSFRFSHSQYLRYVLCRKCLPDSEGKKCFC